MTFKKPELHTDQDETRPSLVGPTPCIPLQLNTNH